MVECALQERVHGLQRSVRGLRPRNDERAKTPVEIDEDREPEEMRSGVSFADTRSEMEARRDVGVDARSAA